eukprot:12764393-Alexandrium_andersonii.AAC.1
MFRRLVPPRCAACRWKGRADCDGFDRPADSGRKHQRPLAFQPWAIALLGSSHEKRGTCGREKSPTSPRRHAR